MNIIRVDQDVAYVAMAVLLCCKRLTQCFICFFKCMLQVCLFVSCICFTHMLQMFYLDGVYMLQRFSSVLCVVCKCFRHTF
jgi:hypothetical protein